MGPLSEVPDGRGGGLRRTGHGPHGVHAEPGKWCGVVCWFDLTCEE